MYIFANGKQLRCGFTTGSTATLATKASAIMLITGKKIEKIEILTPKGVKICEKIQNIKLYNDSVQCAVMKDAGDDIDVTDKLLIYSKVSLNDGGIVISGGEGVGKVTLKGLDQPVGNSAINSVPRKMICENLREISQKYGYTGGFNVEISVPNGEIIAKKTFNEKLGIVGGISILGTSGIVEPQSLRALLDSIEVEFRMNYHQKVRDIIISPGNYAENFIKNDDFLNRMPNIKCSNFIGETLDFAQKYEFERVLLVGHIGKFVKLAGGIMNTHSAVADGRVHIFASYSALCGASRDTIFEIMNSKTCDACIEILKKVDLDQKVMAEIINSAQEYINYRVKIKTGVVMFSNVYGNLGQSNQANEIIENWRKK